MKGKDLTTLVVKSNRCVSFLKAIVLVLRFVFHHTFAIIFHEPGNLTLAWTLCSSASSGHNSQLEVYFKGGWGRLVIQNNATLDITFLHHKSAQGC
mmetsp:Transcript_12386/g.18910  ORF Transcript_12386/g.18910 Transcript_12386/m.18910 type:complete len:96 (+) Transcript_12386:1836-2123(+)